MKVLRIYKNSSEDILRVDTINMLPTTSTTAVGAVDATYYKSFSKEVYVEGSASRVVSSIMINTDADTWESIPSAAANYNWVEWTTENGKALARPVRCNMSNLPQIGDSV